MNIDEDLIREMRSYILAKTGKNYFGRIKSTPKNIMVSCPYHKEGQESKPSCGIQRISSDVSSAGTVHCFSCGATTGIADMMKDLLGTMYDATDVESKFNFTSLTVDNIVNSEPKIHIALPKQENIITEDFLKNFRTYHPYLHQRGISEITAKKYDLGFDAKNQHITFPIKNIMGKCIGIGRRSILRKEYYYPPEMQKPLYGLYELEYPIRYLCIVEGPFNLWSLSEWDKQGVALLGTGTSFQYNQLKDVKCDGYVLALDPDNAGRNGTLKLIKYLTSINKTKIYVIDLPDGKDVNDLSKEEFSQTGLLTFKEWQYKYNFF